MSELKATASGEIRARDSLLGYWWYEKSEADKMIADLKDKCQMHDFFWDGCGFAKRGFKNTIAVSEAFDKLEAENRELKRANGEIAEEHECYLRTETEAYIAELVAEHEDELDKWYAKLCHNKCRRALAMFKYCCAMNWIECNTRPSTMNPHQLWRYLTAYWHRRTNRWFQVYKQYEELVE